MRQNQKPLFIFSLHLGLGGVERRIIDFVNFLADHQPNLPIYIFLKKRSKFDLSFQIKNKNVKIICYSDKIKIPYFFPIFIFYYVWRLKPQAILAFLHLVCLEAIWAKILFFPYKIRVVLNEGHFASTIINTYHFAKLRHFLVKVFYPFADAIISPTTITKTDLVKSYNIDGQKIRVISNWTCLSKKAKWAKKTIDLIYTGRLTKTKDLPFLINSIKKLMRHRPNIKFCIVGDGEEREKIKKMIIKNNLQKNISLAGVVYNIGCFLSKAKIFVYATYYQTEGFPVSILEAMAVGLPVVTTNFAGADEIIKNGENGYIVNSVREFNEQVLMFLEQPQKRKLIGRQAQQYVKKYHSQKNIEKYIKALNLS